MKSGLRQNPGAQQIRIGRASAASHDLALFVMPWMKNRDDKNNW